MPQELQVLRCYKCNMFQIDIIKKIPKWQCKMCGEKQSVQKVYSKGPGKDCRQMVQQLNETYLKKQEVSFSTHHPSTETTHKLSVDVIHPKKSKWSSFLRSEESQCEIVKEIVPPTKKLKLELNYKDFVSDELLKGLFPPDKPMSHESKDVKTSKWQEFTDHKENNTCANANDKIKSSIEQISNSGSSDIKSNPLTAYDNESIFGCKEENLDALLNFE